MAEFEIKVTELEAGGKEYSFPLRSAWLAGELAALGEAAHGLSAPEKDGTVEVFADKSGADVIVRGRIVGGLLAECSRCLGPAPIAVDAELAVLLTAKGKGIRDIVDSDDLSPDELDKEFFTGDVIDLGGLVREHLLLEVPMQPLCRPDCPGIVPVAHKVPPVGAFEKPAVDPRLAPLAAIKLSGSEPPARPARAARVAEPKKRSKRSS